MDLESRKKILIRRSKPEDKSFPPEWERCISGGGIESFSEYGLQRFSLYAKHRALVVVKLSKKK